ncbi:MAG TPA: hypothetical protein VK535_14470, partial [Gemmatimonadales bacterium]|nr:hypothetical protein [Gemmatimonadales bacterium]
MPRLLTPLNTLLAAAGAALLLHACQEPPDVTLPDFARAKPPRTLTITGGGTGSGKVTAPAVLEVGALTCAIAAGTYDPTDCTKTYGWKSSVVLTVTADTGSTFTGWSGACSGTSTTCKVLMVQSRDVRANFSGRGVQSFTLNIAGGGSGNGGVKS